MADPAVPLSIPAIAAALGAAACRFDIDVLAECGSTNAELLLRAARGAPSGTVIVAGRQTAGRGRMGRAWVSAPGDSLTFSLLWRFPGRTNLAGLPLAVGVAVARALDDAGVPGTALKWPNDVLRDGRKLAGILIELHSAAAAVIGIGLNLRLPAAMPAELRATAADLDDLGGIDPNALAATLLARLLAALDEFAVAGLAALRDEWLARHAWTGRPVTVLVPHAARLEGICAGIDDDGALLLETPAGVQRILSGDVSLRLRNDGADARHAGGDAT